MNRLPNPEEVTIADAIAFDAFTDEQKRIALAGVAIHSYLQDRIDDETERVRVEAYDEGYASSNTAFNEHLHAALDRLALVRQQFSTSDTRYLELGEIVGLLTTLVRA